MRNFEYYSCSPIRAGFNFYRSNKAISCCYSVSEPVIIGDISDANIIQKIEKHQNRLIKLHKKGRAPKCCKECPVFFKAKWKDKMNEKWDWVSLNHYTTCNLKCAHCGYVKTDDGETDSDHALVKSLLQKLFESKKLAHNVRIGIGGGEPSISSGMDEIFKFFIQNKIQSQINSNAAKFSPTIAQGINAGLFELILTPDAGSKEIYKKIKGADFFDVAWKNISRYMKETNQNAIVKFILEQGNICDVENMILMSKKANVRFLQLSFDIHELNENCDVEKFRAPVKRFIALAKEEGFNLKVSDYVPRDLYT